MSVAATSVALRRPARPAWGLSILAVIIGSCVALAVNLVWLLPLSRLGGLPIGADGPGHGWPWRIEDVWSLAADVGPLLLSSAVLALVVERFLASESGSRAPRLPLIAAGMLLGWVTVGATSHPGLVPVDGLVAFTGVVAVARWSAGRTRRPLRWTPARVLAAVLGGLLLAGASVSYALLHPLRAGYGDAGRIARGHAELTVGLHNEGRLGVRLLAVEVPGTRVTAVELDGRPLAGSRIAGDDLRFASATVTAPGCADRTVDRLSVRMRVAGREVTQAVRLREPVRLTCAA